MTATAPTTGRWSMRAARAATGTPDRTARQLIARGLLPATDLTGADVLALQVLTACQALPCPDADTQTVRDESAADQARRAWRDAPVDWTLVVTTSAAATATDADRLAAICRVHARGVRLLLPVGHWAAALPGRPSPEEQR